MRFFHLPKPIDVREEKDFEIFIRRIQSLPQGWGGRLALDTETAKGLSLTDNHVVVWSVSDGVERWQLWPEHLWDPRFIALWEDPERMWVMQNAKFDMHQLWLMGVPELRGTPIDTMSMAFLHDENISGLNMEELAAKYLGVKMKKFKEVFGKPKKGVTTSEDVMLDAPAETLLEYSTCDAYITWHISEMLLPLLECIPFSDRCPYFEHAFEYLLEVEAPYTKCLWRMERRGISVNPDKIFKVKLDVERELEELKVSMLQEVGRPDFNFNSGPQLKDYFFNILKLKPKGKPTATGKPSLKSEQLALYAEEGVIFAQLLSRYRTLTKRLSTYILGYFIRDRTLDDRIHCNFKQHGTVTGRLSSDKPNLQNIPGEVEYREIFEADEGYLLGCFDYSQLELRILGHFSGDDNLNYAFLNGMDLHGHTASLMLGVDYDHVLAAKVWDDAKITELVREERYTHSLGSSYRPIIDIWDTDPSIPKRLLNARKAAKTINFGILYGMSPFKLSKTLDISKDEAKKYMEGWFASYPKASDFIERQVEEAEVSEYHTVRSIQGRYRRLPCIISRDTGTRRREERLAVNSTVQGSGGDIAKMAMLLIDRHPLLGGDCLEGGAYGVELLLQVHDELVIQCPQELTGIVEPLLVKFMKEPPLMDIDVPLDVEGGFAPNWGLAK
jgi:DNA polymerase I